MFEEVCEDYMRWYFDEKIWKNVSYRGIRTLKNVSDMWNYQEIFHAHNIGWVIETGSRHGGSGLFFADTLEAKNAEGKVISIDIDSDSNYAPLHPRLEFLIGSSCSPEIVNEIKSRIPEHRMEKIFMILDSDHTKQHVLDELNTLVPLLKSGDYLIVEDSCVNGHPIYPNFGEGPWEAIKEYIKQNPSELSADKKRESKFGFTFAPDGFYIKL